MINEMFCQRLTLRCLIILLCIFHLLQMKVVIENDLKDDTDRKSDFKRLDIFYFYLEDTFACFICTEQIKSGGHLA